MDMAVESGLNINMKHWQMHLKLQLFNGSPKKEGFGDLKQTIIDAALNRKGPSSIWLSPFPFRLK